MKECLRPPCRHGGNLVGWPSVCRLFGVLLLLPPSEGKSAPEVGPKLAPNRLSEPLLRSTRAQVIDALVALCSKHPSKAVGVLGLGPKQASEVTRNAHLRTAPTAAAISVYSGVLYEALDATSLPAAAHRRLDEHVRISSALFGLLRPTDQISAYRLSADVALPGLGPLNGVWRAPMSEVLTAGDGLILDLRSAAYVKLGPAPERALLGRVLLERNGKRSVVSHHNKATKGRLVRDLVMRRTMPKTEDALLSALHDLGYHCEIHEAKKSGQPATLDIVVNEV
jgi:cytoplasmic iron level regulating protein YaaA (DUF328/UPF0246 family)